MVLNTSLPAVLAEVVLQPEGVKHGTITVNALEGGNTQDMFASDGAIGHFSDFDILEGHTVTCVQDGTNYNALFKIFSGDGTQILGNFDATGNIYLVDTAGILFGANSKVNVNKLIASTLDIDNELFKTGNYEFFAGEGNTGAIVNNGTIGDKGLTESVALIGRKILNTGTITTSSGGFVVMAAGDRVLLGNPGSKIVVEMDSVTLSGDGFGNVVNEGAITAPGGKIVLAAGDIFSVPLHPQLQAESGEVADQPVRVESGTGTVTQSGGINRDVIDGGGSVVLTAGDDVILAAGSTTQAIDGEVIAYAYDFGTKEATTSFEDGAVINVGTGTAEICGNHILFAGSVDALPGGTIQVDPVTLTIADTMPTDTGPELDTLYEEEHIEFYSQAGVNLDLAADKLITVEYMADSGEAGEITGGSGDIYLRNIFAEGGIYFEQQNEAEHTGPRSSIRTVAYYESPEVHRDGGNIYMDAGSGEYSPASGIVAGDLFTGVLSQDKIGNPGEIVLRTANGGDIEVGTMQADGASNTQISAISDGDLIVNGNVKAKSQQTDNVVQSVFKAIICLIAEGDVDLNGTNYEVFTQGKGELVADIRISAGGNVTIGSQDAPATITAVSKVAEHKTATKSTAYIVIHAGRNLYDQSKPPEAIPGVITINGQIYTPDEAYLTDPYISAEALNGGVDTSNTPSSSVDTETVWENKGAPPADFFAKIEINSNAPDLSQCADCPTPPGLPPVPHIFIIADDTFPVSWSADDAPLDVLRQAIKDELGNPTRLILGDIADPQPITTDLGGTLKVTELTDEFGEPILDDLGNPIVGFEYTPPSGVDFVWDGESEYASFTDTFLYRAEDSQGNESVNEAAITITVTNFLPTAVGDSETIHMSTDAEFDLTPFVGDPLLAPEGTLVIDPDGTPGTLTLAKGENDVVFGDASVVDDVADTATYEPFEGFVGNDDFDYTVTDSSINYQDEPVTSATLEVTVDNTLPGGDGWIGMVKKNSTDNTQNNLEDGFYFTDADMVGDEFLDTHQLIPGTYYVDQGGILTISYDEVMDEWTYIYTPSADYEGDYVDNWFDTSTYNKSFNPDEAFLVPVWDGQMDYPVEGDPVPVYGEGMIYADIENALAVPYIQPAPGLQREVIEISGCPALVQWVASELGTDESKIQIWMTNALASARGIPPCDACANLKSAATVLQDVDGTRVAALAGIINEFASSTAPPTEEQMASIADAIANDIEGNSQYAAAGEYLDALAKYVGLLTSEMGFSADESIQFATDNYVGQLAEGENMGVAAYVAARLAALGGS